MTQLQKFQALAQARLDYEQALRGFVDTLPGFRLTTSQVHTIETVAARVAQCGAINDFSEADLAELIQDLKAQP